MTGQFYPECSEEFLRDIEIINKYGGFTESEWLDGFYLKTSTFVKKKKSRVLKFIDGDWILGKISDSEYIELTGHQVSDALYRERLSFQADSERYRGNARKALLRF